MYITSIFVCLSKGIDVQQGTAGHSGHEVGKEIDQMFRRQIHNVNIYS